MGSSSDNPAISCAAIKLTIPYKISGFYWIKPVCSKISLRMYCDYSGSGASYGYIGGIKKGSNMPAEIKNIHDIRIECAKIGLYPIQIKSRDQVT